MNRPELPAMHAPARMKLIGSEQKPPSVKTEALPTLLQYLRIAYRRKWIIVGTTLGFLLAGLLFNLLMTPKYTSISQVEISRESNRIVNLQGVEQEASDADQEFYQTQYGLLRSRSLAERVARKLNLSDDPAFFEMFGEDPSEEPGQVIRNGRFAPAGRAYRDRLAGSILLDNVSINPTRLSRLVDIVATTPSAELSARVANAWAENFIQQTLERRYDASSYARDFLENRLEQLRQRLEDSERQLVNYASNERLVSLPGGTDQNGGTSAERSVVSDALEALNSELAKATADRIAASSRYDQLRARGGESSEALANSAINTMRARRAELAADYQKMLAQFEPAYPPAQALQSQIANLDRSIAQEESRVSATIGRNLNGAREREEQLQSRVDELKNQVLDVRRRAIQYNIYQREVDSTRVLYDGLLQRYKEIGITGGVGVNNIAVVDTAAVPDRPSSPRLILNLLLGAFLGFAIGAGLALLLEHVDESIGDPADVRERLGFPLLGAVPRTTGSDPTDELEDRKSELFDAYLAVQTNLNLATDRGLPRTLSVTSTRPGEGKSTTALSLATTLARSGRKVVLVDGDMRSPSVHQLLDRGHERGLSTFLAGNDEVDSLIGQAERFGFSAITAGPLPPNAAELLTSERLSLLLDRLLERFDHVVIDSPPVMGLADALLIAGRVEAVVYVVQSKGVRARLIRTSMARLTDAGANVLGTVLTKYSPERVDYGYGHAYGYTYGRESRA